MTVGPHSWRELDAEARRGTARRRLIPSSRHDLFLAVRHPPGLRMLTMRLPPDQPLAALARAVDRLPSTAALELEIVTLSDGARELQLSLADTVLLDVFDAMIDDVATTVAAVPVAPTAAAGFVERVAQWVHLLQSVGDDGLGDRRRRGLFGELHVLARLLRVGVEPHAAVSAWTAPDGTNQDFQLSRLAIEVKTSASARGDVLHIASERQLDADGTGTLLLTRLLVDERRGGDGSSLNALVDAVRALMADSGTRARFDQKLVRSGYLRHHAHRYDEPRYSIRSETTWRVEQDFPRITAADLRSGVSECSYSVNTTGLDHLTVDTAEFDDLARGG